VDGEERGVTKAASLEDMFGGALVGAAIGDAIGRPSVSGWRDRLFSGTGGQRAAVAAAAALVRHPADVTGFRRAFRCRPLGEEGRVGPPWRLPYQSRAAIRAALSGLFHAWNPWLRYRYAAACAEHPETGGELSLALSCQLASRAAAAAARGGWRDVGAVAPMDALCDLGWTERRRGVAPIRRSAEIVAAADLWETVSYLLRDFWRNGGGVPELMERLVVDLECGPEFADAPLSVFVWGTRPTSLRDGVAEVGLWSETEGGPALAGLLIGATVGLRALPPDLVRLVDREGRWKPRAFERLAAGLARSARSV
jgi:hypothetical protein